MEVCRIAFYRLITFVVHNATVNKKFQEEMLRYCSIQP